MLKRYVLAVLAVVVLVSGCATTGRNLAIKRRTPYDFTGSKTYTVQVQVVDPPEGTTKVWYNYKGAPYGVRMEPVEGKPNFFTAQVPNDTPVSFRVDITNGTENCGGREYPQKTEYCGPIRVFSDADRVPGQFIGWRVVFEAIMSDVNGEKASDGCEGENEDIDMGKWQPHSCSYHTFGY